MRERLDKFIKSEGLTPSRFAEIMAVQPSSISHILGGRNKPSYDFIEKILLRFPKLNPDWLLLGKGNMYRSAEPSPTPSGETTPPPSATSRDFLHTAFFEGEPSAGELDFGLSAQIHQASQTVATTTDRRREENAPFAVTENTPQSAAGIASASPVSIPTRTAAAEPSQNSTARPQQQAAPIQQIVEAFDGDEIERIVVFLKDKTFIDYQPK